MLYLMALFGMKKGKKADEIINLSQQTVESHFQQMAVFAFEYLYGLRDLENYLF